MAVAMAAVTVTAVAVVMAVVAFAVRVPMSTITTSRASIIVRMAVRVLCFVCIHVHLTQSSRSAHNLAEHLAECCTFR
ncbi:hypothetical protein ABL78_3050 [Leptomonas seymouri]|uniref:Uncharacterized protein n=1 Tax=Leptomonas seymouri TaxID=5684 RepID=A0A0N1PCW2_LEPSE|nr:hypothetical protein ABL78_3050 [Leptomonas seymouri]|eukprot:KPI87893.1 hypothetical protein ABL78_3050 [Leptomonas seymouri]